VNIKDLEKGLRRMSGKKEADDSSSVQSSSELSQGQSDSSKETSKEILIFKRETEKRNEQFSGIILRGGEMNKV
jgi:hypothetical protein